MQTLLLFLSFVTLASCHDCVLQPLKIATRGRTYKTPVTELKEGVHPVDKCGFVVVCSSSRAHVCRHKTDKNCPEIGKNCPILAQAGKNGPFRCVSKLPRRLPSVPNFVGFLTRQNSRPSARPTTSLGMKSTDSWCEEEEEITEESKTSSSPTTAATTTTTEDATLTTTKEATTVVSYEEVTTTTEGWKLVREGTTSIPITTTTAITRPYGKGKTRSPFRFPHRSWNNRPKRGIYYRKSYKKHADFRRRQP